MNESNFDATAAQQGGTMLASLARAFLLISCSSGVAWGQAVPQSGQSAELAWRARRAADSVCATYPRVGSSRRDSATGRECRKSGLPTLTAFVLTDHLICPSSTPWTDPNPLQLLNIERIARLEVKRDSLTLAKWRCPSPVDAVVLVLAKPTSGL
jgi:hypothetical protein